MTFRYTSLLLFAVLLAACAQAGVTATSEPQVPQILMEDLVIRPGDFQDAGSSGMALLPEGMMPDSGSSEGAYLSQPIEAPHPFNALVPQWIVEGTDEAEIHLEVRSGNNPSELGEWIAIERSMDWTLAEDSDTVGDMLVVPAQDKTHNFLQYKIQMKRDEENNAPLLSELTFTFIDSTEGPSAQEMAKIQEEIDGGESPSLSFGDQADDAYPKPSVISRDVWCIYAACDYTEGLAYHPVTHLILHHTVSSTGAGGDSADVVRAIWYFHTASRGWKDIGYNYLVDTNGILYEGHLGGDDVVGIHAAGANTGSMALAMIGSYSTSEPPVPMFESAVDLFAWKADKNDIDVFDASNSLPNIAWGLPHLMGHRDVYGTTECPGGVAHALIPALRERIAAAIGLESPHIYVDELSKSFIKSIANWREGPLQCGHNAHSWYAWSTRDGAQSTNWAEWRPDIPESGLYQIEVYAPYCNTGQPETSGARYKVNHSAGASDVVVDMNERVGLWTSLGEFTLDAGSNSSIYLDNLTNSDSGRGVWFDAIRLLPLELLPAVVTEQPTDGSWMQNREAIFTWQISNPEKAEAVILQVATDRAFEDRVVSEIWTTPVLEAAVDLQKDYAELYWRVIVTSAAGNEYPSNTSQFGIDSEPPVSTVTELRWLQQSAVYQVLWQGEDLLSGVESYNIAYRIAGNDEATWEEWLNETVQTGALFSPPDPTEVYEFRSQAIDKLGNQEGPRPDADISTDQALSLPYAALLPLINSD